MFRKFLNVLLLLAFCMSILAIRCKKTPGGSPGQNAFIDNDQNVRKRSDDPDVVDETPDPDPDPEEIEESGTELPEPENPDYPKVNVLIDEESTTRPRSRRQHRFIRNPNYISANKIFDKEAKNMYIGWLPPQHPGAVGGSTNGCEFFDE